MPQHSPFHDGRLLVVAFEGWNDAGEAASGLARRIVDALDLDELREIDGEQYVDYQFNRPNVGSDDDGARGIQWPRIVLHGPGAAGRPVIGATGSEAARDVFVLVGPEPSRTWRAFCAEVIDLADVYAIDAVVFVGAMLADVPHTRPISVFVSSENASVRQAFDVDKSSYEGPTGILGVLSDTMDKAGLTTLSLWASVPHYVHNAPSPKATLSLLDKIEELTDVTVPRGTLLDDATQWEEGIDALAADDEDMASYIGQLEQARDTVDSPEASGDAIAQEFEQYLRRRERKDGPGQAGEGPWRPPQPPQ
ncbi:proteasome assembly chaperone family protein [Curtobacterium sp. MCBA15_001]|uniref:proteasome assembly chaperone family protein n=1 Tax=Curtobacterium sp. MCBA15_001 TaxID=1898731 RepID=UPI0008DDA4B1|nr:PAC2 family protein [Curtobacterium sp. MCBA15_001]OIH93902.1 carboxylate--amine ligase [Curtobacterium sp. MCBA15_001]